VQSGEADAGIVYASDAATATGVIVNFIFPENSHDPIRYPIAACEGASPAAIRFVQYLTGAEAAPLLAQARFIPSPTTQPAANRAIREAPSDWSAVVLSLTVAGCATLLSAIPGVAVAWLLARRRFPGRLLVDLLIHIPLVLPPVAVGFLLLATLGTNRPIGRWLLDTVGLRLAFTWQGAVLAAAVMGFPLLVRAARLAMELVDRRLEHSAATLGASPFRVFMTITLPLALPGVLTGVMLAFARSLGEFGATLYFCGNIAGETRTLPIAIYAHGQTPGAEALAWQLVLVSLGLSLAALAVSDLLARRMTRRLGIV
jgi:molybdate transport system permease protein